MEKSLKTRKIKRRQCLGHTYKHKQAGSLVQRCQNFSQFATCGEWRQALLMWRQALFLQFHYYLDSLIKTTFEGEDVKKML